MYVLLKFVIVCSSCVVRVFTTFVFDVGDADCDCVVMCILQVECVSVGCGLCFIML